MAKINLLILTALLVVSSHINAASIYEAIEGRDLNRIRQILDTDPTQIDAVFYGDLPLNLASTRGYLEIVVYLIERGADINSKFECLSTPIMNAACCGNAEVVKELLKHKPNINVKVYAYYPEGFSTAIILAAERGHQEILQIIRQWSIENQVKLYDWDLKRLAENKLGTVEEYNQEFAAYGQLLDQRKKDTESLVGKVTQIPAYPAKIIFEYMSYDNLD